MNDNFERIFPGFKLLATELQDRLIEQLQQQSNFQLWNRTNDEKSSWWHRFASFFNTETTETTENHDETFLNGITKEVREGIAFEIYKKQLPELHRITIDSLSEDELKTLWDNGIFKSDGYKVSAFLLDAREEIKTIRNKLIKNDALLIICSIELKMFMSVFPRFKRLDDKVKYLIIDKCRKYNKYFQLLAKKENEKFKKYVSLNFPGVDFATEEGIKKLNNNLTPITDRELVIFKHLLPEFKALNENQQKKLIIAARNGVPNYKKLIKESEDTSGYMNHFDTTGMTAALSIVEATTLHISEKNKEELLKMLFREARQELDHIFVIRLENQGIDLTIFSEEEKKELISKFSSADQVDLNFEQPELKSFRNKLEAHYDDDFGFLFKNNRTLEQLLKLNSSKEQLIKDVNADWGIESNHVNDIYQTSYQYLFANFQLRLNNYGEEMLRAYRVYRFLGIASEHGTLNVGTHFTANIFELNAMHQDRHVIKSFTEILEALYKPIRPFFLELVNIAQTESNSFMICLRMFMPFIVMAIFLAFGYPAILPFALHSYIEILLFFPSVYLSLFVASQYVEFKNYLYLKFVEVLWGSKYEASIFDPTQKLNALLGPENASLVKQYYILSLENCDSLNKMYSENECNINEKKLIQEVKKGLYDELQQIRSITTRSDIATNIVKDRLGKYKSLFTEIYPSLVQSYVHSKENEHKQSLKIQLDIFKKRRKLIEEIDSRLSELQTNNTPLLAV